eukprot:COSAG06_NODE_296_length_18097_cov_302.227081_11_plen_189_part_00
MASSCPDLQLIVPGTLLYNHPSAFDIGVARRCLSNAVSQSQREAAAAGRQATGGQCHDTCRGCTPALLRDHTIVVAHASRERAVCPISACVAICHGLCAAPRSGPVTLSSQASSRTTAQQGALSHTRKWPLGKLSRAPTPRLVPGRRSRASSWREPGRGTASGLRPARHGSARHSWRRSSSSRPRSTG